MKQKNETTNINAKLRKCFENFSFWDFCKKNKYGIFGSLVFHLILLVFLFSFQLHTKKEFIESKILIEIPLELTEQIAREKEEAIKKALENKQTNEKEDEILRSIATNEDAKKTAIDPGQNIKDLIEELKSQLNLNEVGEDFNFKDAVNQTESEDVEKNKAQKQQKLDSLKSLEHSGQSSVHYMLKNRYQTNLPIPVFMCEGAGKVVVRIGVNRAGKVNVAKILKDQCKVQDDCLFRAALHAAEKSQFNTMYSAPKTQYGTITYHFIKQ